MSLHGYIEVEQSKMFLQAKGFSLVEISLHTRIYYQ